MFLKSGRKAEELLVNAPKSIQNDINENMRVLLSYCQIPFLAPFIPPLLSVEM